MKKIYSTSYFVFLIILTFSFVNSDAQTIPNSNFENWNINNTWSYTPDYWLTTNTQLLTPITQDLDAYDGVYATKLTITGSGFGPEDYAATGFSINSMPDNLHFYGKYERDAGAYLALDCVFYNNGTQVTANVWVANEMEVEDWTAFSIPFVDLGAVDSCSIRLSGMGGDFIPGDGWMSIDKLEFDVSNSIEETSLSNINIYPNPVKDVLHLENITPNHQVKIYSIDGKLVYQNRGEVQINVSSLAFGAYILHLYDANGEVEFIKFDKLK